MKIIFKKTQTISQATHYKKTCLSVLSKKTIEYLPLLDFKQWMKISKKTIMNQVFIILNNFENEICG